MPTKDAGCITIPEVLGSASVPSCVLITCRGLRCHACINQTDTAPPRHNSPLNGVQKSMLCLRESPYLYSYFSLFFPQQTAYSLFIHLARALIFSPSELTYRIFIISMAPLPKSGGALIFQQRCSPCAGVCFVRSSGKRGISGAVYLLLPILFRFIFFRVSFSRFL